MAIPESVRNAHPLGGIVLIFVCLVAIAMQTAKTRTTATRTATAKFEGTFSTPFLAKTAVSPANSADSNAQIW